MLLLILFTKKWKKRTENTVWILVFRIFVVVIIDLLTKKKEIFLPIECLLHESHRKFINLTTYTRQSLKVSLLTWKHWHRNFRPKLSHLLGQVHLCSAACHAENSIKCSKFVIICWKRKRRWDIAHTFFWLKPRQTISILDYYVNKRTVRIK